MDNTTTIKITNRITKDKAMDKTITKAKTFTKDNTITKENTITKAKTKTNTEDNIYTRIKYERKKSNEAFKSKVPLTTHSFSHNKL